MSIAIAITVNKSSTSFIKLSVTRSLDLRFLSASCDASRDMNVQRVPKQALCCVRPRAVHARRSIKVAAIPSAGAPNAFLTAEDEEQFMAALNLEIANKRIPKQLYPLWTDFFQSFKTAILSADLPTHDIKLVAEVQASIADVVMNQFVDPYTFPSYHEAIREPYDYFEFGQKYVGVLINFTKSYLGFRERFDKIAEQLKNGENVILLANHQSEADPGVFAHMLIKSHPELAYKVIYVAGDRVITDPLCKPFSMGRNLFCVHSKRYIDVDPATKDAKVATNRKTLRGMAQALNSGGTLIWIAPAGGRDRPNDEDVYTPAKFDPASVELMRTLAKKAEKAGVTSHLYPFAMYSAPVMPPPKTIDTTLGERRIVNFTGVGISVGEAMDPDAITAGIEDREVAAGTFSAAVYAKVCGLYTELEAAVKDPAAAAAGKHFSQPWLNAAAPEAASPKAAAPKAAAPEAAAPKAAAPKAAAPEAAAPKAAASEVAAPKAAASEAPAPKASAPEAAAPKKGESPPVPVASS